MKAIRIEQYGGPEVLIHEDIEVPEPGQGEVQRMPSWRSGASLASRY
jgi:NADPH:quinone reductase-like Zn-dependent oxidoreductase